MLCFICFGHIKCVFRTDSEVVSRNLQRKSRGSGRPDGSRSAHPHPRPSLPFPSRSRLRAASRFPGTEAAAEGLEGARGVSGHQLVFLADRTLRGKRSGSEHPAAPGSPLRRGAPADRGGSCGRFLVAAGFRLVAARGVPLTGCSLERGCSGQGASVPSRRQWQQEAQWS